MTFYRGRLWQCVVVGCHRLVTRRAKAFDGEAETMTGYFVSDFTMDEISKLQVRIADAR